MPGGLPLRLPSGMGKPLGMSGMGVAAGAAIAGRGRGAAMGLPGRKRMNVANPKALRRAIRRQAGFVKLARRALKGSGYTIVSKGSRRPKNIVKESGPGSVTIQ